MCEKCRYFHSEMEGLDDFYGLQCLVCMETFSFDPASSLAPAAVACGHYVCVGCHKKMREPSLKGIRNWKYKCTYCDCLEYYNSNCVALGYQDLIERITKELTDRSIDPVARLSACLKLKGFNCCNCDFTLSSSSAGCWAPIWSSCGHFLCRLCTKKLLRREKNGEYCVKCVKCDQRTKHLSRTDCEVAFGFLGFMVEMRKKYDEYLTNMLNFLKCSNCSQSIHVNKAVICSKCVNDVSNTPLSPLCFECVFREHRSTDHVMIDYYAVKNKKESIDAKEASELTISGYKTLINDINDSHMAEIGKIKEIVQVVCDRMQELPSVEECLDTLNKLKVEMHMFKEAIDILIPVANSVNNTLKEINSNIGRILPTEK